MSSDFFLFFPLKIQVANLGEELWKSLVRWEKSLATGNRANVCEYTESRYTY